MQHHPGPTGWLPERIRKIQRATFAAIVAAVATVGVASATIPSNGVIDACYSRSGGALRVIDSTVTKCGKQETALAWNVQGPAGPQGEQGPEGPAGPAGENGISAGFGVSRTEALLIDSVAAAGIVVVSKTLPAGNYVLTARLNVFSPGNAPGRCWIPGDLVTFVLEADTPEDHVALTSAITHAGGAIEIRCAKGQSDLANFTVDDASLTGVRVDTLE